MGELQVRKPETISNAFLERQQIINIESHFPQSRFNDGKKPFSTVTPKCSMLFV